MMTDMTKLTFALILLIYSMVMLIPVQSLGKPADKQKNRHVLLFILENENFNTVNNDPYFRQLKAQGAWFSNSWSPAQSDGSITHPSYPNYLALVAGDTFDLTSDDQQDFPTSAPGGKYQTIADLLELQGLTWKSYAQGYPGTSANCFKNKDNIPTRYARKHVPFLSFKAITGTSRCGNVVNAQRGFDIFVRSNRLTDLKNQLPNFSFYTPDMDNDGHNTNLQVASTWLKSILSPLLENAEFMRDTLIIVTFDESADHSGPENGHIFTAMFGPMIKMGEDKTRINHYTVLRTIETLFGLGQLTEHDRGEKPLPIS